MKKPRKPIQKSAPMLVMRTLNNVTMESQERIAVTALSKGFANTKHFDTLAELMNLLIISGELDKRHEPMKLYAENTLAPVLFSIKDRYNKTGKLGVSAPELIVLRELIDKSKAFWLGTSTGFYNQCVDQLNQFYADIAKEKVA